MEVRFVEYQKLWDEFVYKANYNTFLHSNSWKQFNIRDGHKTWNLGLFTDKNLLVSVMLVIKIEAKRGCFLFCPHGPISNNSLNSEISSEGLYFEEMKSWLDFLKKLSKTEKASFIRIQPIVKDSQKSREVFSRLNFRFAPIHMHTELTTVLNIEKSADELMLGMRKTTRQMIKKGDSLLESGSATLEVYDSIDDEIWDVYTSTSERGKFVGYSRMYLENELLSFQKYGKVHLYGIKFEGKLASWGMVVVSGKRAFYHQGGNQLVRDVPSSYMCQWEGIKWAKEQGCISYDFWGVSPIDNPHHPWAKISLFKRGFGGEDVKLLHAQDYVLNYKYWFNWLIESYRAKKRGFSE